MQSVETKEAALVGGGAMAIDFHLPRLLGLLGVARLDIIETSPARRATLTERYASESRVRVLDDFSAGVRYQLGVIAVPPAYHASVVKRAVGCCERLLIEKPLCLNAAEGEQVVSACSGLNVQAFVCLPRRALNHLTMLKSLMASGSFGSLRKVSLHEGRPFGWKAASYAYFLKEQSGGGVLMDLGPHVLDQLLQLFEDLKLLESRTDAETGAIEANCRLSLLANGSTPVSLWLSRNRYLSNTMILDFEAAECRVSLHQEEIVVRPGSGVPYRIGPISEGAGFEVALDRIYAEKLAVGDNRGFSPSDSLPHLHLIDQAYHQATPFASDECF